MEGLWLIPNMYSPLILSTLFSFLLKDVGPVRSSIIFDEIQKLLIHCCIKIQNGVLNICLICCWCHRSLVLVHVTWESPSLSPLLSFALWALVQPPTWFDVETPSIIGSTNELQPTWFSGTHTAFFWAPQGVCQLSDKICWFAGFLQHLTISGLEMMRWKKRSRICTYFSSSVCAILCNYRAFVFYVVPCYANKTSNLIVIFSWTWRISKFFLVQQDHLRMNSSTGSNNHLSL